MSFAAVSSTGLTGRSSSFASGSASLKRSSKAQIRCNRAAIVTEAKVRDIVMPALSSTMTEGRIVSWLKNEGDEVKKGEPIVVVESDKADMDVESFNSGILGAIVVGEGQVCNVGLPIGYIAETADEVAEAKAKAGAAAAPAAAPAAAAPPPPPAAQAAAPAPAPAPAAATATAPPPPPPPPPAPMGPQPRADGRVIATPYAKKLAKDLKVDLAKVGGTGPNGRITAEDVQRVAGGGAVPAAPAVASSNGAPAAAAPRGPAPAPTPSPANTNVSELKGKTVPFTTMQNAVAKNMIESLKVPEFRVSYTITTDALDALYKRLKPKGVTMSALLAKACGLALAQHPIIYAATTPDGKGITYGDAPHIAMAVAMPDGGLITPVLSNADTTDIYQMSRNWADLVKRARSKQLSPNEYTTGNFTISNLGMFGVDTFDAVLPPGTGAIIAIGGSKPTVVATEDGFMGVKKQMTVNLTADHRHIYGADAAEFLKTLASIIENPDQLTF